MGRTLDTLNWGETEPSGQIEEAPAGGEPPQLQVVPAEEPAEEMPYIEVGGRGKTVEGSPDVLAAALRPAVPRAPALAMQAPLTVAFRPFPAPSSPAPRMAPEVIAYHHPDHEVGKQYRALLRQLLLEPCDDGGRALLFSALSPGAGVTTALLNLAVTACAAEGREVVLLEANCQRPALAGRLGLAPGPGLYELLAGSAALEQVVRGTVQERLHVLTAGAGRPARLSTDAVRWVVAWLRQRFELIFLDGPAWSEGADHGPLITAADSVLLVLDQADSERPQVRSVVRSIARLGGQLGGLLVTR
jgi:Mrp family chromosome partitioning ATPase